MEVHLSTQSYDRYGSHYSLGYIPDLLIPHDASFGSAVKSITITLHFKSSGKSKKTLESDYDQFHCHRQTLPKVTFRRKKRQFDIHVASDILDGSDEERAFGLYLDLFQAGVGEFIDALELCRQRLKKADDFDLDRLLAVCRSKTEALPSSHSALEAAWAVCKAQRQAKLDVMSPWDKLGIDWEEYHPDARGTLDDPFYWECANDFAPHGNDTGADLLADYMQKAKRSPPSNPGRYLNTLARSWGYASFDEMEEEVRDQASVAFAFAEIKKKCSCSSEAKNLALEAIARQKAAAEEARSWAHREECIQRKDMLYALLRGMG